MLAQKAELIALYMPYNWLLRGLLINTQTLNMLLLLFMYMGLCIYKKETDYFRRKTQIPSGDYVYLF
jgi:hypothetical protein